MQSTIKTLTLFAIAFSTFGCGTVVPPPIKDGGASYDDSTPIGIEPRSSGFICFDTDAQGNAIGAVITSNARDRYNALVAKYAARMKSDYGVEIQKDSGIVGTLEINGTKCYRITSEKLALFMRMARWSKQEVGK